MAPLCQIYKGCKIYFKSLNFHHGSWKYKIWIVCFHMKDLCFFKSTDILNAPCLYFSTANSYVSAFYCASALLSTGNGRHSDAAHEIRLICAQNSYTIRLFPGPSIAYHLSGDWHHSKRCIFILYCRFHFSWFFLPKTSYQWLLFHYLLDRNRKKYQTPSCQISWDFLNVV